MTHCAVVVEHLLGASEILLGRLKWIPQFDARANRFVGTRSIMKCLKAPGYRAGDGHLLSHSVRQDRIRRLRKIRGRILHLSWPFEIPRGTVAIHQEEPAEHD